jgi:hypothetical protein
VRWKLWQLECWRLLGWVQRDRLRTGCIYIGVRKSLSRQQKASEQSKVDQGRGIIIPLKISNSCHNKRHIFCLASGWAVEAFGGVSRWQLGGCLRLLSSPLWHPMPAAMAEGGQSWAHQGTMDERGESVSSFGAKSAERDDETGDNGRNTWGRFSSHALMV